MTAVRSRWWYLVAGIAVWAIVSTVLLVTTIVLGAGGSLLVWLSYGSIALLVLLPVGLYMDGRRVAEAPIAWDPDVTLYVVGGIVGILAPVVSVAVAGNYLYRRHEHVGVP